MTPLSALALSVVALVALAGLLVGAIAAAWKAGDSHGRAVAELEELRDELAEIRANVEASKEAGRAVREEFAALDRAGDDAVIGRLFGAPAAEAGDDDRPNPPPDAPTG